MYTVPETDGTFKKITLPLKKLKPKCLITGELIDGEKIEETMNLCRLYPHDQCYYEAKVIGVKRKKETTKKSKY